MQKRKFWEIVFQWVFPCALLVVALVLSIYEFNNKMNSAIQTVVDDQAEQIGFYYSAGVDDKLGALGDITSAMANIMASRPDRSDAFVYEKLDTIVKASNAYMSAYCATNGKGMLSDRREFDMSELNYYGSISGTSAHYIYAGTDGINGQTAFIYVCPIAISGNVTGYLLSYMNPDDMKEFFDNSVYGDKAFFSLVNGFENKFRGMWAAGVVVKIPVFHWGEGIYKVKAAKAEANIARYKLEDIKEKVELQVTQNSYKVNESTKKLALAEKNMEKAEENLRYANLGFKEGVIPTSNVLEAQTAWFSAQAGKIDAQIDVKMSELYLNKSMGILK
jgi:hypothetical protein